MSKQDLDSWVRKGFIICIHILLDLYFMYLSPAPATILQSYSD